MNENELRKIKSQIKYYFAQVYFRTKPDGIHHVLELENRVDFLLHILQRDVRQKRFNKLKMKLPLELIQHILKIKWWNARKKRLERILALPNLVKVNSRWGEKCFKSEFDKNERRYTFIFIYQGFNILKCLYFHPSNHVFSEKTLVFRSIDYVYPIDSTILEI